MATLYKHIMSEEGLIPEDWFASQVEQADRTDGDIDTLSNRIAHIRTWTFVSNRREWLKDPDHWQAKTRDVEDRLSDALHEQLTQRFVDKRTSVLMKSMRDKESLFAEIEKDGRVVVEKHYVGKLEGFCFTPDLAAAGVHGKAARNAAAKVLVHELAARSDRLAAAPDTAFTLTREGKLVWEHQEIGGLASGEDPLKPNFTLFSDEHLAAIDKENITKRIETWLGHHIEVRLKPLVEIAKAEEIAGLARGIAFRLRENFGVLSRDTVADEIKSLDQDSRAQLRKYGVRFGAHHIYFPLLLKPASADLLLLFWLLKHGSEHNLTAAAMSDAPRQGLTSVPRNAALPDEYYRAAGFGVTGPRAVRVDMLERLADIIRPLTAWKPTEANTEPPVGAAGGGAFKIRPEMMSIMGCSGEELSAILESLGFRREMRPVKRSKAEASEKKAANDNVDQAVELSGAEEATASQIAPEAQAVEAVQTEAALAPETSEAEESGGAAEPSVAEVEAAEPLVAAVEAAEPPVAVVEVEAAESSNGLDASIEPASLTPDEATPQTADSPSAEIQDEATPQTADSLSAGNAEPEFEEIWRFRRPKPKFERPEAQGERRHHRRPSGDRGHRPHHDRGRAPNAAPTAAAPAGEQIQPPAERLNDQASAGHREHGQRPNRHNDRSHHKPHDGDRNRDRGRQPAPKLRLAKTEGSEQRPAGNSQQRSKPPYQGHRDRPHDRSRNSRPPRQQGGRQPVAASAAPKRASGGVDPQFAVRGSGSA